MEKSAETMDLSGHYAVETWQKVDEIVRPFTAELGINYFSYVKITKNDSRIILCNQPYFLLDYYVHGVYTSERVDLAKIKPGLNYRAWSMYPSSPDNLIANEHNIYHRASCVIKQESSSEIFSFGAPESAHVDALPYLNGSSLIWKFIFYFREQARSLIEDAETIKLNPEGTLDFYDSACQAPPLKVDQYVKRLYLGDDFQERYLTRRELDVIKWLTMGKTAEEISIIISASKRTVECHIANIKEKLNCTTLFQLGETVSRLSLLDAID